MSRVRALAVFASLLLSAPATACVRLIPSHPQVVAAAEAIFEATVTNGLRGPVDRPYMDRSKTYLRLRVDRRVKGMVGAATVNVPTSDCSVPQFRKGELVTVVRFSKGNYVVVMRRPAVSGGANGP